MKSKQLLIILVSALVGYLIYRIVAPFIIPLFWALVFSIMFHPYYNWLLRRVTRNSSIAAFIACLTIAVFFIVPMTLLAALLAKETYALYLHTESFAEGLTGRTYADIIAGVPYLKEYVMPRYDVTQIDLGAMLSNAGKQAAAYMLGGIKGAVIDITTVLIDVIIAFFAMFFLFKDGGRIIETLRDLTPLDRRDTDRIIKKSSSVITATINGGIIAGLVQGALCGAGFWYTGLGSPLIWIFLTFVLSFLPGVGTALVWAPAAAYLLLTGDYTGGVILIAWCGIIAGIIDNVLRPAIVSGRTALHPFLLFLSILGAVTAFGIVGIIAGPFILSMAVTLLDIYREGIKASAANE